MSQHLHELISLIYKTAADPDLWPQLLQQIARELEPSLASEMSLVASAGYGSAKPVGGVVPADSESGETFLPFVDELAYHFESALRINQQVNQAQAGYIHGMDIVEQLPLAIVLVDERLQVRQMNPAARRLLKASSFLRLRKNHLACASLADTIALRRGLEQAAETQQPSIVSVQADDKMQASILIKPGSGADLPPGEMPVYTLFVATNAQNTPPSPHLLESLFGLSPAEARLGSELACGLSLEEAAGKLCISTHTARSHLKAMYAKTGVNKQHTLVKQFLSSPAIMQVGRSQDLSKAVAIDEDCIRLKDGRKLSFAQYGQPDGIPVLFFHSIVGCRLQIHPDQGCIDTAGIRWVVPERPGFGRSDPHASRTLLSWADDMVSLLDHLQLEKVYLAGFSAGGAYAAAMAWRCPERIQRTVLISPMAPYTSLESLKGMPPTNRLLMLMAHHMPRMLEPMMRLMLQGLIRNPEQITRRHIELWPQADREVMSRPGIEPFMVRVFREAVRQGADAIVQEQRLLATDWGFKPADIAGDVLIWHGREDIHVPFAMLSPYDFIAYNKRHFLGGWGHYLLMEYWKDIFTELVGSGPVAEIRS